jgi:2-polyprenyl-6-methoxyphenol hydroxylase-like FAD-dependent oxidoreductase
MRKHNIGIVGCGTAGGAAALFLSQAGHEVTVYERVATPRPVGAGIVLQPTGLSVLARLGFYKHAIERGSVFRGLRCETLQRRRVVDIKYRDLSAGLFGLGLHRGVLFDALFQEVRRSPIACCLGVAAEDLAPAENGRQYLVDVDRKRYGPHDVIIIADGARSRLRDDTRFQKEIQEYPWGALWFLAQDPERRFQDRLYQVVDGASRMVGFLPTGLGPAPGATTPLVSLFWSIRKDRVEEWRNGSLSAWKQEVLRFVPEADGVLDQISSLEQLQFTSYFHVQMKHWHENNVVYLGDAGHAMSPQLGQGCNLALYDAMVLADCLAEISEPRAALREYSRRRAEHLRFYQFATRWLTPFFQSDSAALGLLRDTVLGTFSGVPFVRREMARSMSGTKSGFLFGSVPVPTLAEPF